MQTKANSVLLGSECFAEIEPTNPGASGDYFYGLLRELIAPLDTIDEGFYGEFTVDATGGAESLTARVDTFEFSAAGANITFQPTTGMRTGAASFNAEEELCAFAKIHGLIIDLQNTEVTQPGAGIADVKGGGAVSPSVQSWAEMPWDTLGALEVDANPGRRMRSCFAVEGGLAVAAGDGITFNFSAGIWLARFCALGSR